MALPMDCHYYLYGLLYFVWLEKQVSNENGVNGEELVWYRHNMAKK